MSRVEEVRAQAKSAALAEVHRLQREGVTDPVVLEAAAEREAVWASRSLLFESVSGDRFAGMGLPATSPGSVNPVSDLPTSADTDGGPSHPTSAKFADRGVVFGALFGNADAQAELQRIYDDADAGRSRSRLDGGER